MESFDAVVVGGGPAGLAAAACLRHRNVKAVVLEEGTEVGPAWHHHYERLHLHTNKAASGLPHRPMPRDYPRYPSRDQVARYLETYAEDEQLDVRTSTTVGKVSPTPGGFITTTRDGTEFDSTWVVIATGLSQLPVIPQVPGMNLFEGEVLHTAEYENGEPWRLKRALVVGFGNSAGEIALDLCEHGAECDISVRSPSVVVPRDILGIPILTIARWLSVLPPRTADTLSKPLLRLSVGDVSDVGIPAASWGPLEQIASKGKIPLLDVGTMKALKDGLITARPGLDRFTRDGVVFSDGSESVYDVVVFGTGYRAAASDLIEDGEALFDERGRPLVSGGATSMPRLFFCGFREPPTGRLREIGLEAERIADLVAADMGSGAATS